MNNKDATSSMHQKKQDWLDELIEKENLDEMSLLDLVFMEEMLHQERNDNVL